MGRTRTSIIAALLGAALACGRQQGGRTWLSAQALSVDGTSPIGAKYDALGGAAVLGAATTVVETLPNGDQSQRFENGVIVASVDWGAVLLSAAVFDKWVSLQAARTVTGQDVFSYLGSPRADVVVSTDLQSADFERGTILARPSDGAAWAVYGAIYGAYRDVAPRLGLPTAEEAAAPLGGRMQTFQNGDVYWRSATGAHAVLGAIRALWLGTGGATGALGYPTGDDVAVMRDGFEAGRSSRFQNGNVYFNGATGATAAVLGDLRAAYENAYAGAAGWLGFPKASGTTAAGTEWSDFDEGMLVKASSISPSVWAFQNLDLYWAYMVGHGKDCAFGICGAMDIYLQTWITTPTLSGVYNRIPGSGDCSGGCTIGWTWPMANPVSHDFFLDLTVHAWDADTVGSDDGLGWYHAIYTVDNLFGILDAVRHHASESDRSSDVDWAIRNPIPYDTKNFVGNLGWQFENFSTSTLTYDQFAKTFRDVGPAETWLFHPFNKTFYNLVYKGLADGGNCFGMSTTSALAQVNHLQWAEPIYRFPKSDSIVDEINVKHGYQVSGEAIDWWLSQFTAGLTHDPKFVFEATELAYALGQYPVLTLTSDYFGGAAHAVRPYAWDRDASGWRMWIWDNNWPNVPRYVSVDPSANRFEYEIYSGTAWTGGRMSFFPLAVLDREPRTPFDEVMLLLGSGAFVVFGDTGQAVQIADGEGRTFYDPALAAAPTRWDQVRSDAAGRIPDFARVPVSDAQAGAAAPEMYFAKNTTGATHAYTVGLAPGVQDGTPYDWTFNSAALSARYMVPGTRGVPDVIEARDLGTAGKTVSIRVPANGQQKAIAFSVAGALKNRFAELRDVKLVPGQKLGVRLAEAGYRLVFENDGPRTTAALTVVAGPGAPAVTRTITIPGGESEVQYRNPETSLTLSGGTAGNAGWWVAPPTVTLDAVDYSGRGIRLVEYRVDAGDWQRYTNPVAYAWEGATTLAYRAQDKAGNLEVPRTEPLRVDTRAPVVTASADRATYSRTDPFVVHFSATDPAPGSGLDTVEALLDGAPVQDGQVVDLLWTGLGTHTLAVTAKDVAGWTATRSVSFQLAVTAESLADEIRALYARGEIDSWGIERSLLAKLGGWATLGGWHATSGRLHALEAELRAQAGRHITQRAADLLLSDVRALEQSLP